MKTFVITLGGEKLIRRFFSFSPSNIYFSQVRIKFNNGIFCSAFIDNLWKFKELVFFINRLIIAEWIMKNAMLEKAE